MSGWSGWGSVSQRMQVFYSRSEKRGIFCPVGGQRGQPEDNDEEIGKLVRGHCSSPDRMTEAVLGQRW